MLFRSHTKHILISNKLERTNTKSNEAHTHTEDTPTPGPSTLDVTPTNIGLPFGASHPDLFDLPGVPSHKRKAVVAQIVVLLQKWIHVFLHMTTILDIVQLRLYL